MALGSSSPRKGRTLPRRTARIWAFMAAIG
jgi:hypothetical protein